ncbi:hypothetical protein [Corynebacterium guangdongense]|uniref:Uncharacterized protein n=1 Tax=Corynebacterium guangdongense TaxID=1783348 RepID=A0ABU1ZZH6_9CORY|nr:hypothetical protein [Corynebacterium guangdongense]MDR7329803.1 hypothetical protein [Corynebacterium guangdongense]WJZ18366.1 hypothetical protein CGUA_09025 [Corynebacterium guangdongense]
MASTPDNSDSQHSPRLKRRAFRRRTDAAPAPLSPAARNALRRAGRMAAVPKNPAPPPPGSADSDAQAAEEYRALTPAPEPAAGAPVPELTETAVPDRPEAESVDEPATPPATTPLAAEDETAPATIVPEPVAADLPGTGTAEEEDSSTDGVAGAGGPEDASDVEKRTPADGEAARAASTTVTVAEAPRESNAPLRGRRRKWARAAYSVALVGILGGAIGLGAYEANADRWPSRETEVPAGFGPPVDWNTQEVLNLVIPAVLSQADATTTEQGVILTAQASPAAVAQPQLLARQISTLTQNSCATNVSIRTPENVKIDSWGFCFDSLPAELLTMPLTFALDNGASAVSFTNHPSFGGAKAATITWMPTTPEEYDRALASWGQLATEAPLDWIALVVYGAGEMEGYMDYADVKDDDGLVMGDNSRTSRAAELGIYADRYPTE